eukprot:217641_1
MQYCSKTDCYDQLNDECSRGYLWDEESMLCGWNEDETTEKGDSGGPALMNGLLSGVNSWCLRMLVLLGIGLRTTNSTETYVVGIHICDETWAGSSGAFCVTLHGVMDDSSTLALSSNTDLY